MRCSSTSATLRSRSVHSTARLHTRSRPISTSGIFLPPLKNLQRDQELCRSYTNCVAPGPKRVQRKTGSTQDHGQAAQGQAQQDVSRRSPLSTHVFLASSRGRATGISDTTWAYLRKSNQASDVTPTTKATSDKPPSKAMHTQKTRSKLKRTTAACPVLGLVPAGAWDGRPPVLGLVARQGVPAPLLLFLGVCSPHGRICTESHSGAFLLNQLVVRDSWRLTPLVLQQSRLAVASNAEHSCI